MSATEYQVYHPAFEAVMEPIARATHVEAEQLKSQLSKTLGGWEIRTVTLGSEPIPKQDVLPTIITVHEARKLMAKHGQDMLIIVAWNGKDSTVNLVTSGSNRAYSEGAYDLSKALAKALELGESSLSEDRRSEHQE